MRAWRGPDLLLAAAGALLVACNAVSGVGDFTFDRDPTFTPGATGGGGAQGGGGAGVGGSFFKTCDDEPACGGAGDDKAGCLECAVNKLGPCGDAAAACGALSLCSAYMGCMNSCPSLYQQCVKDCDVYLPGGAMEYAPVARCLYCEACTTACMNPGVDCEP